MKTIARKKKIFLDNRLYILQLDISSILELEERYTDSLLIYKSLFKSNISTTNLFINLTKILSCCVKNTYINDITMKKLLIKEYKKPIHVVNNIYPVIAYLIDGFIIENNETKEDLPEATPEKVQEVETKDDILISDLMNFDKLYINSLKANLTKEDFLSSTPKGLLYIFKSITDNNTGETEEDRNVYR